MRELCSSKMFFHCKIICRLQSPILAFVSTGTTPDTSGDTTIQAGSLLDDGQWHDVEIVREEQNLSLTVDRLTMPNVTNGDFYQLDLDRKVMFSVRRRTSCSMPGCLCSTCTSQLN